ncbi:hypothetical protein BV20DRAFT_506207 [Pilatotrama ljubarskyi]|nr:hypothetical protein BV20DRAFT_506207 [Pilatotrama ljubarskyi]
MPGSTPWRKLYRKRFLWAILWPMSCSGARTASCASWRAARQALRAQRRHLRACSGVERTIRRTNRVCARSVASQRPLLRFLSRLEQSDSIMLALCLP